MKEETLREFLETYFELNRKDTELNQCLIRNLTDVLTWIFEMAPNYYNWFMLLCPQPLKEEIDYFIFEGWVIQYNPDTDDMIEFDLEDRDIDTFIKFIKYAYPDVLTN